MKLGITILQFLGLMIILLLFWAFQSTETISEAKRLDKLSDELFDKGQYENAFAKVLEAKALYEEEENWEKVVECLWAAFRYEGYVPLLKGEPYLRQAIALSEQHLPTYHTLKGDVYQELGEWYNINGQYDSSLIALNIASNIYEQLEEWDHKAWVMIVTANSYYRNNALDSMKLILKEAEQLAQQKQLIPDIFDAIYALFGAYYYTILNIEKAIYYNNCSLQLLENKADKINSDSIVLANTYHNQGLNYIQHFNLQRAEFCFSKCLSIYDASVTSPNEFIDVYTSYSDVLYELKKYDKSIAILEKIKHIKKEGFSEREYIKNLGNIYNAFTKNYFTTLKLDSASFYVDKLMNLYKNEAEIPNNVLIKKSQLLFYQKEYKAAEEILKPITIKYENESPALTKENKFKRYNNMSRVYNILGQSLYALGKNEEALRCFQQSLATNLSNFDDINDINQPTSIQNPFNVKHILTTLHLKALTLEAINTEESQQQALNTYQVAIEWTETMRQSMVFDASKEQLNTFSDIYKNAVSLAAKLYQTTNKAEYLAAAFEWSEKEKAVILLDNLIGKQGKLATNVPEDLLEREARIKRNLTFFQQNRLKLENDKESSNYQRNEQRFTEANIQLAKLKDTLQTYYQSYFNLEYQSSIATIPTIQQDLLQSQQALIQYFTADSLFYVFVIDKNSSQLVTLPKGEKENELLKALQTNLQQANTINQTEQENFQDFVDLAYQGYQTILEPITSRLPTDVKELIIVPDAALNYLPFEVLLSEAVTTKKVDYLTLPYTLHDYQFHYGYSGTLLLENQRQYEQLETNDKILAYAPPYQSSEPIAQRGTMRTLRSDVAQLKGAAKEIQAIANYFEGKFDCSPTATKANFTKQVSDFGILHLAMHGQSSLDDPSEAHLVFSNLDNETDKANLLHHYEITALETQAQLAVLSACETGVGKEIEGEGVMSLGRGFMYAGIPSIVMSLWKMNDQSTSELMPLFYKNLSEGMRKDKALHQAKLAYLKNALPEQAHPFYWSGFVSLGDAQPIKKANATFPFWWIGALIMLVGVLIFWWYQRSTA